MKLDYTLSRIQAYREHCRLLDVPRRSSQTPKIPPIYPGNRYANEWNLSRNSRKKIPAKVRQVVRNRAIGRCELCGVKSGRDCHHLTYSVRNLDTPAGRLPGFPIFGIERPCDLIYLCRACHSQQHWGDKWPNIDEVYRRQGISARDVFTNVAQLCVRRIVADGLAAGLFQRTKSRCAKCLWPMILKTNEPDAICVNPLCSCTRETNIPHLVRG